MGRARRVATTAAATATPRVAPTAASNLGTSIARSVSACTRRVANPASGTNTPTTGATATTGRSEISIPRPIGRGRTARATVLGNWRRAPRSPATTTSAITTSSSARVAAWARSKLAEYAELMPQVRVG